MKRILILALAFVFIPHWASAQTADPNCSYKISKKDVSVKWTAFKTPAKVGVDGNFTDISFKEGKGKTHFDAAKGLDFTINSGKISTGDPARDAKIVGFFFNAMKDKKIKGKINAMSATETDIDFTFNGVSQKLAFENKFEGDTLTATGTLDVLHFKMDSALAALTKACFEKHEGKTWPDVNVTITAKFQKVCSKKSNS